MAVLSDADRTDIWRTWMQENKEQCGVLTKADVRAAVDAIDAWTESNTAAFNTSIPQPARTVLTTKQKARIFMEVVERRFLAP